MQRKLLAATVAAGPILALALAAPQAASAQTLVTISSATTAPIATATVNNGGTGDIAIATAGSITPTVAGPIITLNSNNTVLVGGSLTTSGVSDSTGIQVAAGNTGSVNLVSNISLTSTYEQKDTNGDGNLDGPFADGQNRFGIRVIGPGSFNGDVILAGASILISGNDSAGIAIDSGLNGNLNLTGNLNVTGDRNYGIRVGGPVTGSIRFQGTDSVYGLNATGIAIDGDVTGLTTIQGSVTATGFRYQIRPILESDRAKLGDDDLLPGGPVVRIAGNLAKGVIFDAAPALKVDTVDANGDGVLDYLAVDSDGDGIADSNEGTADIIGYGSGPGVLVGSNTRAITLGVVGTGTSAYGFVNKGTISVDGLYDGFASTAVQVGGSAGFGVNLANGLNNLGLISANAYQADSTALRLTAGANAPAIMNTGSITAAGTSTLANTIRSISIQKGATVAALTNDHGVITATATGATMNAIAIEDLNGGLRRIDNSGLIGAAITNTTTTATTGKAIAVDARANTLGLTLRQTSTPSATITTDSDGDGVNDVDEAAINGSILFGSGDDRLELTNGLLKGDVSFGAGADVLSISGTANMAGALTDSDGRLAISIDNGSLSITNAETIRATSLNLTAATSQLLLAIDPVNRTNTRIVVDTANIANNAEIGVTLRSVLDSAQRYTVVDAGRLTAGTVRSGLTNSPYLYVSSATADTAAGKIYVDVRPRTAGELGFNSTEAGAYSAVLAALKTDDALAYPLLVQTGRAGLVHLYDQLLPDLGRGTFDALSYGYEQIAQGVSVRPDPYDRYGPDSFWAQEINSLVRTETSDTMGSDTQVFGFAGGYEAMGEYGGALGVAVSYMNIQERDNDAQVGERANSSVLQGDLYWRRSVGGFHFTLGGGGGYGWMKGERRFFSGDLNGDGVNDLERSNSAAWNAYTGHAFTSVSYQQGFGRYYLRPDGRMDFLYLHEGERKESGGGSGFDLLTKARSSSALTASAGMTFGANFGHDLWWRPEIRVGYRQQIAGTIGDTVAQFTGGSPFTLTSSNNKDGAVTLDMALRAGTPMSYVALEGGVAAAKKQKRYNVRLAGRMMF